MKKVLPQISLDFGPEPEPTASPAPEKEMRKPAGKESAAVPEEIVRQYAAAGVGVRLKSLKPAKVVVNGDLFGTTAAMEPEAARPATEPLAAEGSREFTEVTPVTGVALVAEVASVAEVTSVVEAASPVIAEPVMVAAPPQPEPRTKKPRVTARPTRATSKENKSKRGRKSLKQVAAEADLIEIPGDEVLFSKQYYTMGEVSIMFRVNQSLLRFWETEFDIIQPRKNKKGDRYFRPVDIKNLHLIYHLLRQRKYTIEGAKEFLKKNKKAEERFEAIQRLQQIKAFLLEWKAQL